ncbi:MAG: STAS domain-containing protein [Burkholderiales bacterium]
MIEKDGERYRLKGPVTLLNAGELLTEGERLFTGQQIVLDLGGITDADSSALSLMLEWGRRVKSRGAELTYANLGEDLESLAGLYGISDLIPRAAN